MHGGWQGYFFPRKCQEGPRHVLYFSENPPNNLAVSNNNNYYYYYYKLTVLGMNPEGGQQR